MVLRGTRLVSYSFSITRVYHNVARTCGEKIVLAVFNSGGDPLEAVIPIEALVPGSIYTGAHFEGYRV